MTKRQDNVFGALYNRVGHVTCWMLMRSTGFKLMESLGCYRFHRNLDSLDIKLNTQFHERLWTLCEYEMRGRTRK